MVDNNPDYYLWKIREMLINEQYELKEDDYYVFTIHDRDKDRELMKLDYYPHRIIQRAIMLQIEKLLTQTFTFFTCASIPKRWGKRVMNLMDKYMKDVEGTKYCLKIDIKKFYPSINHSILKQLLRKKIKCKKTLRLLDIIIDSHPWEVWLPIGSYLSQYLANFYLAYFDHFMKEELRIKYVIRYMDDIVILADSKEKLRGRFYKMKEYLDWLELTIKDNRQIFPVDARWVDFVWYRYFHWYRLLRKKTAKRMKKKMNDIEVNKHKKRLKLNHSEWCSIVSYIWWLVHCDGYRLHWKYIQPLIPLVLKYYEENINPNKVKTFENKLERLR